MPKGGVLHVHEFGMTSAEWVINDLSYRDHFCMCDPGAIEEVRCVQCPFSKYRMFVRGKCDLICYLEHSFDRIDKNI